MRVMRSFPRNSTALGLGVALALVFTVAGSATANAASPINPNNRPTPLAGVANGVVPLSRLVNVAPNCLTAREAGPSLARIFAMAREVNDNLGAEQCYRPLSDEVNFAIQANQPGNNPACVATVGTTASGAPVGHSYHGWGKAADLTDSGQSLTFGSRGYAIMKQIAGSLGWNHPAFAEPGGSSCPEPWHWEWVGDGGNLGASPVVGDAVALLPSADDRGYAVVDGLGGIHPHGNFKNRGSAAATHISWVMVGAASTANRGGYWMVGADGGVFTFGNAHFYGSTGGLDLKQPVNQIAPTKSGKGYWLLAWDGGVFSFGDAHFYGSTGAMHLNRPVDGMARTPNGKGYWLVASDGGVFSFGNAHFYGSTGGIRLNSPIIGMTRTATGKGYWMVASDGGVFTFGDAHFYGSLGGAHASSPTVAIVPTRTGHGYWLELANRQVFGFGDART
jgi:D-alanyl-D-alanine carboxypeptidase